MADISKITLPSGDAYDIKDSTARQVVSKQANGLAPKLPNETTTTKYLRQDGTWVVPPDTQYDAITNSEIDSLMSSIFDN